MKITEDDAAVIKGMLARDDKQQWVVAWFGGDINPGRLAEINTEQRFAHVDPAPRSRLPPIGPYVSGQSAHRALLALGPVKAAVDRAIRELTVNALKTILAMSFVLDRRSSRGDAVGVTVIESRGVAYRIEFFVDHVNNQPKILHLTARSSVIAGTRITVRWPQNEAARLFAYVAPQFVELVRAYRWFNPHLSLRGAWLGREFVNVKATNPNWEKWQPRNPTSPHWYDEARFQRYLTAHVAHDRDPGQSRTVRAFVGRTVGTVARPLTRLRHWTGNIRCSYGLPGHIT
jgi:hypothetical protein